MERTRERKSELDGFWFLGSNHWSLDLLWFLRPRAPGSIQFVSSFLGASWNWAPLTCDSDLILDPAWLWCTSPTPKRDTHSYQHHWDEMLYSLLRIGLCRAANTVLLALLGRSAFGMSECVFGVGLIDSWSSPAFTLQEPGQSCCFSNRKQRNTTSGRYHPGPRSLTL